MKHIFWILKNNTFFRKRVLAFPLLSWTDASMLLFSCSLISLNSLARAKCRKAESFILSADSFMLRSMATCSPLRRRTRRIDCRGPRSASSQEPVPRKMGCQPLGPNKNLLNLSCFSRVRGNLGGRDFLIPVSLRFRLGFDFQSLGRKVGRVFQSRRHETEATKVSFHLRDRKKVMRYIRKLLRYRFSFQTRSPGLFERIIKFGKARERERRNH